MYAILVGAAVVENFFPPAPADLIIALAAFLSHRGTTSVGMVFALTWIANVGGAALVYLVARRLGRDFFQTGMGRRLLSPEAVVAIEREYVRFGLLGLFVARLIPGLRSITAPFAGLLRLGPLLALLPIAIASALWYGTLILVAARLGSNWDGVIRFLEGLNRGLGIVGVVLVLALLIGLLRRGRRRRAAAMHEALRDYPELEGRITLDPGAAAVAALLLTTRLADEPLDATELAGLESHLRARWGLGGAGGAEHDPEAAQRLIARLEPAAREGLARRLRAAAFRDGDHARWERHVMARVARILDLPPPEA